MLSKVPLTAGFDDVSTLSGTATYSGYGGANFNTGNPDLKSFTGAAEVNLVADFDDNTLSGDMTNWVSSNGDTEILEGSVILSNGVIFNGTVAGDVNGAISRIDRTYPGARTVPEIDTYNLIGSFDGGFYDTDEGAASHVVANIDAGFNGNAGTIDGFFVAEQ